MHIYIYNIRIVPYLNTVMAVSTSYNGSRKDWSEYFKWLTTSTVWLITRFLPPIRFMVAMVSFISFSYNNWPSLVSFHFNAFKTATLTFSGDPIHLAKAVSFRNIFLYFLAYAFKSLFLVLSTK